MGSRLLLITASVYDATNTGANDVELTPSKQLASTKRLCYLRILEVMEGNEDIIAQLKRLQEEELSIIRLSEPISIANAPSALNRESDVSSDAFENPSPASLAADLEHYKANSIKSSSPLQVLTALQELFSKLRFSYLEQVTKEKFLRAIVGDPPQIIEHHENIELEAQLVTVKAELKAQKLAVASMVEELEAQGRELSTRECSILPTTSADLSL